MRRRRLRWWVADRLDRLPWPWAWALAERIEPHDVDVIAMVQSITRLATIAMIARNSDGFCKLIEGVSDEIKDAFRFVYEATRMSTSSTCVRSRT